MGDLVFETEQGVRDVFVRVDRARVESSDKEFIYKRPGWTGFAF